MARINGVPIEDHHICFDHVENKSESASDDEDEIMAKHAGLNGSINDISSGYSIKETPEKEVEMKHC